MNTVLGTYTMSPRIYILHKVTLIIAQEQHQANVFVFYSTLNINLHLYHIWQTTVRTNHDTTQYFRTKETRTDALSCLHSARYVVIHFGELKM